MEVNEDEYKRLTKVLKRIQASKIENVQKLMELPFDRLNELKKTYWDAASAQEEDGKILSAKVIREKYWQVNEALDIIKGNETEVWDFIS